MPVLKAPGASRTGSLASKNRCAGCCLDFGWHCKGEFLRSATLGIESAESKEIKTQLYNLSRYTPKTCFSTSSLVKLNRISPLNVFRVFRT
jgi:hypothetical protein